MSNGIERPRIEGSGFQSSERARNRITGITVVVPSLDEKGTISSVRDTLRSQRKHLSQDTSLRLVISDNGSDSETQDVYQRLVAEENERQGVDKLDVEVITGSKKGFVGSARQKGIENAVDVFHERNPDASSDNHLIICFDADTKFKKEDSLKRLEGLFTNQETMVAYGPVRFETSSGKVSTDYQRFQRPFTRALLGYLFLRNRRLMTDYINGPYEIFHAAFTAIRESALVEGNDNSSHDIVTNYNPEDRTGDDVRMSLLLQRRLPKSAIVFDKGLTVLTSARSYEKGKGNFSRSMLLRNAFKLFGDTEYVPYSIKREIDLIPEEEDRIKIKKGLRFVDVVGSFTDGVDREVYGLEEGECLVWGVVGERTARKNDRKDNRRSLPAKDLKTGDLIPGKFVRIRQE